MFCLYCDDGANLVDSKSLWQPLLWLREEDMTIINDAVFVRNFGGDYGYCYCQGVRGP